MLGKTQRIAARVIAVGFLLYAFALFFSSNMTMSLLWLVVGIIWIWYHERLARVR